MGRPCPLLASPVVGGGTTDGVYSLFADPLASVVLFGISAVTAVTRPGYDSSGAESESGTLPVSQHAVFNTYWRRVQQLDHTRRLFHIFDSRVEACFSARSRDDSGEIVSSVHEGRSCVADPDIRKKDYS